MKLSIVDDEPTLDVSLLHDEVFVLCVLCNITERLIHGQYVMLSVFCSSQQSLTFAIVVLTGLVVDSGPTKQLYRVSV